MLLLHCASSRSGMPFARECPSHKRGPMPLSLQRIRSLKNEIIGKPSDLEEAAQMLRRLSGQTHEVCSAVLICHQTSGRSALFHDISPVRFHRLNRAMIKRYLAKVNPLDKAGAYAAQGTGAEIIAKIEGSSSNVVGLPMEKTIAALAKFGIRQRRTRNDGFPAVASKSTATQAIVPRIQMICSRLSDRSRIVFVCRLCRARIKRTVLLLTRIRIEWVTAVTPPCARTPASNALSLIPVAQKMMF
jgi:hypothetical protein